MRCRPSCRRGEFGKVGLWRAGCCMVELREWLITEKHAALEQWRAGDERATLAREEFLAQLNEDCLTDKWDK